MFPSRSLCECATQVFRKRNRHSRERRDKDRLNAHEVSVVQNDSVEHAASFFQPRDLSLLNRDSFLYETLPRSSIEREGFICEKGSLAPFSYQLGEIY